MFLIDNSKSTTYHPIFDADGKPERQGVKLTGRISSIGGTTPFAVQKEARCPTFQDQYQTAPNLL